MLATEPMQSPNEVPQSNPALPWKDLILYPVRLKALAAFQGRRLT